MVVSPIERLTYFIKERESVRLKKEAKLPKPWTDNVVLQKYRFCNVRRMDDKVSQWLLRHWYNKYKDHHNMVVAATIARHFNLPDVLDLFTALIFRAGPPNFEKIKQVARERKAAGFNIFNGAYMIRGVSNADKTEMVIDKVCRPLEVNRPQIDTTSMEKSVQALLPYWGLSSFMAGQIVADLRHGLTGRWSDRHNWAPIGPGSKRGMNRLHSRPVDQVLHQDQFLTELKELIHTLTGTLFVTISKRLEAIDYQNCLCEFDKMERVVNGEGRPKQLYNGVQ